MRAVRPGHVGDRRLMLEHRVGAVPVRECGCPQPPFIDCKKPPFMAKRWTIPDPVPPPSLPSNTTGYGSLWPSPPSPPSPMASAPHSAPTH